jgi:hypothetical protein
MKKALISLLFLTLYIIGCHAATKFEYYPQKIRIYGLLKTPSPEAESSFTFPIDVTLTGVSKDKKWYRFKVSYDLVFFGKYDYEGWCKADPWEPFSGGATPEVIELQ